MRPKFIYGFSPTPKSYAGITLYPFIFTWYKKHEVPEWFVNHEMTHFNQVEDVGWFSFYISYLCYFFAGLLRYKSWQKAYWEIPYEIEARRAEDTMGQ